MNSKASQKNLRCNPKKNKSMTLDLFSRMGEVFRPEIQVHKAENNHVSQQILNCNRKHFGKQTKKIFDILMTGEKLTQIDAAVKYKVHSLSRRACDIIDSGYELTRELCAGSRLMVYYMNHEQIRKNKLL